MMTPAYAPSTPCSHDPLVDETFPFWYSLVSSPRYHTFPALSCAYQSSVTSTKPPPPRRVTVSRSTNASTPWIRFLRFVTSTTIRSVSER